MFTIKFEKFNIGLYYLLFDKYLKKPLFTIGGIKMYVFVNWEVQVIILNLNFFRI